MFVKIVQLKSRNLSEYYYTLNINIRHVIEGRNRNELVQKDLDRTMQ